MGDVDNTVYHRGTNVDFWLKDYNRGRPVTPPSFLRKILNYHTSHGGRLDTAHDVGSGGGFYSLILAEHFKRIILTEPSEHALGVAKDVLAAHPSSTAFEFIHGIGEHAVVPESTVDLIWVANSIQWMNVDQALLEFHRQIRPGGTLVIVNFHWLVLDDVGAQAIWREIMEARLRGLAALSNERIRTTHRISGIGIDLFSLPETMWQPGVQRHKLNTNNDPMAFWLAPKSLGCDLNAVSGVGPHDQLYNGVDQDWPVEFDIDFLRAYLVTFPCIESMDASEPGLQQLSDLARGGKLKARCPVQLLLATKRKA